MITTTTLVIVAIALLSIYIQWPQPKLDVDFYSNLAAEYIGSDRSDINNDNVIPLKDVIIVITGATSGLGFAITSRLHELGGTIIAIGRSPSKLDRLREQLDGTSLSEGNKVLSTQRLFPIVADFEDLGSVSAAADVISSRFRRIDFLINNAGIHYFPAGKRTSSQGYDIVFGVNYLSHFLLTEKLLPKMTTSKTKYSPRIIQISSLMHFGVNGEDLVPTINGGAPKASKPLNSLLHKELSYGNSKLAQIYHARSLTRELISQKGKKSSLVQTVSICPSWVRTFIGGKSGWFLLKFFAFEAHGFGISSILYGMFHPDVGSNDSSDFVTNTKFLPLFHPMSLMFSRIKNRFLRYLVGWILAISVGSVQKFMPGVTYVETSKESYSVQNQDALYQWSKEAISPWM